MAPDVLKMTSVALKAHHGRHVRAEASGDLKAASATVGEAEKFDLICHPDGKISLRSCHGKFVATERSGELKALREDAEQAEKFELQCHADGAISLRGEQGYVAAEKGCTLRANRSKAGAWEKFTVKDRSSRGRAAAGADATAGAAGPRGAEGAAPPEVPPPPLFDACCQLEAVLSAEATYAARHSDKTAVEYKRRARQRREKGLELSFGHFRQEQRYPAHFAGCVSAWDATAIRLSDEELEEASPDVGSAGSNGRLPAPSRRAWSVLLSEEAKERPLVLAAFGVPAASAAEADDSAFQRLERLCDSKDCAAIGPVGLDFTESIGREPAGEVKARHAGLSHAAITAEFGCPHTAVYEPKNDPACHNWLTAGGASTEAWATKHGDRRLREFEATKADYERRRREAQVTVVQRQLELARRRSIPLILQLPPQDEAERKMAEMLVAVLGEGSTQPLLLSSFQGRPKFVGLLLKLFPNLLVGFSGLLTHAKLKDNLGEVAFDTPLPRLVLESLGPRYPPAELSASRGSFSHPAHVDAVAAEVAKVKMLAGKAEVLQAAWSNASRLFGLAGRQRSSRQEEEAALPQGVSG